MLDHEILQNRGFCNVGPVGARTGFQVRFRIPSYRGMWASLIDGVDVTVDGERFDRRSLIWTFGGRDYSYEALRSSTDVRWQLDEAAIVTVPKPGGLSAGTHQVSIDLGLRMSYIPLEYQPTVQSASRILTIVPDEGDFKYGVSVFSYTGDYGIDIGLEDAMQEIHDMGATGIEILGEGHVAGYPQPSVAWRDAWFEKLERYSLEPTNFGSWIDTRMWVDRDMTVDEGHRYLLRDVELAASLGFRFVRPKIGVVSRDLQPHPIWNEVVERTLDRAAELDIVICPEIHSPTPIRSKVVDDYVAFIERTGTKHFGILIDTGIFQTVASPTKPVSGRKLGGGGRPEWENPLAVPMADFLDIMPYVVFIQAKFQRVDDDLIDRYIPWADIVRTLKKGGYTGYLSSEYEGDKVPWLPAEQVRRQHAMIRSLEAATAEDEVRAGGSFAHELSS